MATVVLPELSRSLYPFKSHFLTLSDGKRMHYLDEGPEDGEVLVFLHGYPTWSFLYRAFLIYYAARGFRCIAVDHIGYGLSDKPANRRYHTLRRHVYNLIECIHALDLRDVTLVMQDWGGPFGLGYAVRYPENVKRLVLMNTWGFQDTFDHPLHPWIKLLTRPGLSDLLLSSPNLVFGMGFQYGTARHLSSAVIAAYKAPFKDSRSRTALVQFPRMISTSATHPSANMMRAIEQGLEGFRKTPALIVWGEDDPLFSPDVAAHWKAMLPRAEGPFVIETARHFLPEDAPEDVILRLDTFLEETD
jgi:pimeloyl-ACP methyl ester carboxylesterase